MMPKDKITRYIAFVCTGNTCRSPMAEGIFNKRAEEKGLDVRAVSFGLAAVPGLTPSDKAVEVCREASTSAATARILSMIFKSANWKSSIACRSGT